jgi:succinate dehydrogenase / fumarate reductase cytochrome b subunit
MGRLWRLFLSSIGAKVAMAVTGLLTFLWLIGHLLGNLLIYGGPDVTNAYAHGLKELGALLWVARIVMLVLFVIHILSAYRVWRKNNAARPEAYEVYDPAWATYAGRTMWWGGVLILLFVIYHLLHFTLGVTNPAYFKLVDPQGRQDVYSMIIRSFSNKVISGVYILAMVVLGFHLSHGVSVLFQTLGLSRSPNSPFFKRLGPVCAVVMVLGFISIPLSVLAGLLRLP